MLQLPADSINQYPFIQVKKADILGIYIPPNSNFIGGEILQTMHCLELVISGTNKVFSGDKPQIINEGFIQFRKRGNYQLHPSKNYSALFFFFENEFIHDFLKEHIVTYTQEAFTADMKPFVFKSTGFINSYIIETSTYITSPVNYSSCIVKLSLHQILLYILANEQTKQFVTFLKYIISDHKINLAYFMEKNYTQNIDLKDFAKQTGRSLSSFKADFKKQLGTSPQKWLINRRLEYAHYLLSINSDTIAGIAYQCGFVNNTHFTKSYRNKYGVAPKNTKSIDTISSTTKK